MAIANLEKSALTWFAAIPANGKFVKSVECLRQFFAAIGFIHTNGLDLGDKARQGLNEARTKMQDLVVNW